MKSTKYPKRWFLFFTVFVDMILVASVFFLMQYVQQLLERDVKINLTEIVTQNKDVITSKLMLEVNSLDLIADQILERYNQLPAKHESGLRQIFLPYLQEKEDARLFLASADGQAVFPDGMTLDISGRQYFRRAMEGSQNISERTVSRRDGADIFVICVPLYDQNQIIGTVQKQFTNEEMYNICAVSLFSEQGYMDIINSQGYILISSQRDVYSRESDNYYRTLYLDSPEAAKQLQTDIENDRAGFMETVQDGQKIFSAYTPIDQIYDWYLISSVATTAVSPNANLVVKWFYFILLAVVLIFSLIILYYWMMKRRQQRDLERVAFVDPVTGGDTYAKFSFDLQTMLQTLPEKRLYIFTFDIDNFKYINSCYGFDVGDGILRGINRLYQKRLAAHERIARVYSDHFVALLEDASEPYLNTLFQSELEVDGVAVYLSAGLYPITDRTESVNLMVDKANMAARKIKGMRYKRVEVYSEEFDRQMIRNEQTKRAIEQALAAGEIIPFFQPKVDIDSRALLGAEALARWRTREGKLVPPGEFIPVCEQTGLIVLVDMAIFEHTLRFIKRNLDRGIACVPISVNFSRTHLLNREFVSVILEKLRRYGVPPHLVELELTETVIFDNYKMIEEFIKEMHANGLQISMDDFGSGYSSLHMLKDMEIDVLKIDRGFLRDTSDSERQKAVFAAITQMAERLNIKVVVEGVETLEHIALMREFGCHIAQGFYFARPVGEQEFEQFYQEGTVC